MPISDILTRAEASSCASPACMRCSLSGPTWAVALLYDPADSSSSLHGMILRKLSLLVPRGLTIGAWSTPRAQWAADAFPALPVSRQCETPGPASVLPAAGPASSFPFPTTSCASAADLGRSEERRVGGGGG